MGEGMGSVGIMEQGCEKEVNSSAINREWATLSTVLKIKSGTMSGSKNSWVSCHLTKEMSWNPPVGNFSGGEIGKKVYPLKMAG